LGEGVIPHQVRDRPIVVLHRVVVWDEGERRLRVELLPRASHLLRGVREQVDRLLAALAALLAAC
jgi:hypothetical protein